MKTYAQIPVVMDKGEGATITDIDGKKYVYSKEFESGSRGNYAIKCMEK